MSQSFLPSALSSGESLRGREVPRVVSCRFWIGQKLFFYGGGFSSGGRFSQGRFSFSLVPPLSPPFYRSGFALPPRLKVPSPLRYG